VFLLDPVSRVPRVRCAPAVSLDLAFWRAASLDQNISAVRVYRFFSFPVLYGDDVEVMFLDSRH
jgi:hypothetical protein